MKKVLLAMAVSTVFMISCGNEGNGTATQDSTLSKVDTQATPPVDSMVKIDTNTVAAGDTSLKINVDTLGN